MSALYVLAAAFTFIISLYCYFTKTFDYWKVRNVASPKPVPLFGNLLDSALRRRNIGEVYKEIYDQFPNEKVVGVYRMITPTLLIRDLDIIKDILIKDFDSFSDRGYSFSKNGLGNNLFHADSDHWRILRSRFTPIFTSGKLKNMIYLMEERGDKLIEHIQHLTPSEQDVLPFFKMYTMATISACAFGLDINTISDKMSVFREIDETIFSPSFLDELDMMYPSILRTFKINPLPRTVRDFFSQIVSIVIAQRNGLPTSRKDFMDLILEMRQENNILRKNNNDEVITTLELTEDIIAAQALVFYAAGYETSATTMAFMVYELAKHPDIQNKVIAEVDEVLKKHDGKLTLEALNEMTYMEKVYRETQRLYPIVEPLQRRAQHDYKIRGTDVTVKKDQMVLIPAMGIHYDEKYYPNPKKFDPERFSPENSSSRHVCAHIPFGSGPRNCIGMRFAKYQIAVCLTKFFSKFLVEPSRGTPPAVQFAPRRLVMAPRGGIPINIVPR